MNKNKIITDYIINKLIHELDELQIWQENIANSIKNLDYKLPDIGYSIEHIFIEMSSTTRASIDKIYELQEFLNNEQE